MYDSVQQSVEIAYAKINLALHVRKRRDDGYHELETLFAFADQGDVLTAELADELSLTIIGPFAEGLSAGSDNLVIRAAQALQSKGQGARICLLKNLPIASGIGGGSADAAAALRLLKRLWALDTDLLPIATKLGADVPACLYSHSLFGEGVGDQLQRWSAHDISGAPVLLVNPRLSCPTGPIFAAWDGIDRGVLDPDDWQKGRNDLEAPAIALLPQINSVLGVLQKLPDLRLARMSGSGATCFALFHSHAARDAACISVQNSHPHWWTMAVTLR
jgi:4-diphosphocytidyl-2-C-methyl-D-erythritol kinase